MSLFRRLFAYVTRKHPEWVRPEVGDLLESAPDCLVIVNVDGRIVVVNSQTEILFGYSRQELIGQPVEILIPARLERLHVGASRVISRRAARSSYGRWAGTSRQT